MASADDAGKRALVAALRGALGEARVTSCLDDGDIDPRTAQHVSGRPVGVPCCWVRPETTLHCAEIVRIARTHAARVCPVGEATTFWDGLRVAGAVAVDVSRLRAPLVVDRVRRIAWVGAGCPVRAVDREARAHGLCLAAYPDTSGDTPVGSILAVGSTAGQGLGVAIPVDQITGATVVLGTGDVVRAGAGHALGGASFLRHGLPDVLGILTSAEGRAAIITEVGVSLRPAPYAVRGRGRRRIDGAPDAERLLALLEAARAAMDRGTLATFRVELAVADGEPAPSLDLLFECTSARGAEDAAAEAARLRAAVEPLLGAPVAIALESDAARSGALPEYDARFDVPPGDHRKRIEGGAFWGAEVAVSWGDDLRACLGQLLTVQAELGAAAPHHRRLGLYPALYGVAAGVQVLGRGEPERVTQVAAVLDRALRGLLAAGGVPYRTGNLWRDAVASRLQVVSEGFADPTEAVKRALRALDPDGVLPGPGDGAGDRARIRRALLSAHDDLVAVEGDVDLALPIEGGRINLKIAPARATGAQVRGRAWSLAYRVEGALPPAEGERARGLLRAVAETFLRVEGASADDASIPGLESRVEAARRSPGALAVQVPAALIADPSLLSDAVDRIRRADIDAGVAVVLAGLPPCLDTAVRPEPLAAPAPRVHTPLVAPCNACGAAVYCPANSAPRAPIAGPLRVLRHQDATAAALAAVHAVAAEWKKPVPAAALEAVLALLTDRVGVLGVPPVPFELSLKRSAAALLPRLRLVEYSPRSRAGLPTREERASPRAARLVALAEVLGASDARGWIDAVVSAQPPGLELSFGVDADLEGGPVLPQIYAHVEPRDRVRMVDTLRAVLAWGGAASSEVERYVPLVEWPDEAVRSDVTLVSLSPADGAPRRVKVYFGRALSEGHATGLRPADPGPLRPYAPARGLAVLACEEGAICWEKWDFPCAAHYQRASGLAAAFARGLPSEEGARVERLLDGRRFAAWPTWLSVRPGEATLYFVPR
jgi:FAD/FMN-containing dehydrogenase